jgi:hypothetical protein
MSGGGTQDRRPTRRTRTGQGRAAGSGGSSTREVRQWAKDQGIQVNERGRIPADVRVKFEEAKTS